MGNLYTYLLDNGLNDIELTPFIYSQSSLEIKKDFLNKIDRIDLFSTKKYVKDSIEYKIFDMLQTISKDDEEVYDLLNDRIFIDNIALSDKNNSDNVIFKFEAEDDTKKNEFYELKLSEILKKYRNQTAALTKVFDNFEPSIKPFLSSKFFKAKQKKHNEIIKEIHELEEEVLTPYQIFFLLLHNRNNPSVEVFKSKLNISKYYDKYRDTEVYKENVIKLLEILIQFNYPNINFVLNGVSINNYIFDEKYSIPEEILPKFIFEWLDTKPDKKEEKLKFLYKLGVNNNDSEIVLLRKGLLDNDKEVFEKGKVNLTNDNLLLNTMKWVSKTQDEDNYDLSVQRILLKDIYEKIGEIYGTPKINLDKALLIHKNYLHNPLPNWEAQQKRLKVIRDKCNEHRSRIKFLKENLYIPVLLKYSKTKYTFIKPDGHTFHEFENEKWNPFQQEIFDFIKSKEEWVVDDLLPKGIVLYIKPLSFSSEIRVAPEELLENSISIIEVLKYYNDWQKSSEINIRLYNKNQLPATLFYNDTEIKPIENKTEDLVDDTYYTCFKDKHSILTSLKKILDEDDYNSLFTFFNESKIIEKDDDAVNKPISFTEEESRALENLFGNDIPPEFFKDLNLAACVAALVQLNKERYDVSKAEIGLCSSHKYSQLEPVVSPDGQITLTVMCRSAIGGILYLRASSWDRLDNDEIQLFVKAGRKDNQFHLFENKQSVLDISQTNYQVFRVEAESSESNTDSILKGDFEKEKIWLILKMKDKEEYRSIFEGNIVNPEW